MITGYDYTVIGFYVVFMLCLGVVFKGLSKNTSDYFRCGGSMPWWITGCSAWLVTFSAWTFVGAASEIYKSGLKVMLLFYASIPGLLLVAWITSVRFRRMRVVTWMEAVRERFGPVSEQFYTWIKVPVELVKAAIGLMTIAVFMAAVFNLPINSIIVVLGVTITIVAFAGGAFAVLASDFVQMLLVMTITLLAVVLTLRRPEIGGLAGLVEKVSAQHPGHFQWWLSFRPAILIGWGFAFTCVKFAELNSMEYSTMYLMPKSEPHARRMVAIPLIGGLVGPLLWVIPPLAATVIFPDLARVFPNLSKPTEGAFVAVALKVMPVGLIGLLMCAMFGATLTQMDAAVNKYVGVFVRSFYRPIIRPDAPEKHMLVVGKICTLVFGAVIIVLSLLVNSSRSTDVFTLLNQVMVSVGLPLTIPVFLGLFYVRTPGWSAWGTALVGFCFSAWANFGFKVRMESPDFLMQIPAVFRELLGNPAKPLSAPERADLLLVVTALGTILVSIACFFISALFFGRPPAAVDRKRATHFFTNLRTPLRPKEDAAMSDEPVYRMLGVLCMVYGAFILLLILIPNGLGGRLCFLFVSGVIGAAGLVLYYVANKKRIIERHEAAAATGAWLSSNMKSIIRLLAIMAFTAAIARGAERITSPDGLVAVEFSLQPGGVPAYQVDYRGQQLVLESRLGFPTFSAGFTQLRASRDQHHGEWTYEFGERRTIPDNYRELNVELQHASGRVLRVTFRAYNEGAALRYTFPDQAIKKFEFATGELTEFRFPENTIGWEEHGTEGEYRRVSVGTIEPYCERPLTLEFANGAFASLAEAANTAYPRMLLSALPGTPNALVTALGGTSSNLARVSEFAQRHNPAVTLVAGDSTPWRMLVVGDKPGDLLERNYLMLDLNPPCALKDTSWIKPGKAMRDTTITTTNSKAIIDFAATAGLSYTHLDWKWYGPVEFEAAGDVLVRAPNLDVPEIVRYGREKGVDLIMYIDRRQVKRDRDHIFSMFEQWGVKGVKIGFVDVGPQEETAWITETIQKAAEHHLLLNIHDGYRSTGLSRTWPNLLTVEGIRGNEHFPTAEHNCTLPFTRYVAGPGDYTVCYYDKRLVNTTHAHQLAMAVVSFSPLQWIFWYDRPAQYHGEPEVEFFREVPTVWDETRVLNGRIGEFATIARRRGDAWFIGTINAKEARTVKVPLTFLTSGKKYTAHLYSDDHRVATATKVAVTTRTVESETTLEVPLVANGGQAIWLEPLKNETAP